MNTTAPVLAAALAAVVPPGTTFSSITTQLKGDLRGRGPDRRVYGDDLVRDTLVLGFSYRKMLEASQRLLSTMDPVVVLEESRSLGILGADGEITAGIVHDAFAELQASFAKPYSGDGEASTFSPLVHEGVRVPGCYVYSGEGGEGRPVPGTTYVRGVHVGRKVLVPAVNGPVPAPKSSAKTVVKDLIRRRLPVGGFVSYVLDVGRGFRLRVGGPEILSEDFGGSPIPSVVISAVIHG